MKELLRNWIESYDKDSKVYRVLIGKSGNILKLMKEVKQKTLERVEECFFTFNHYGETGKGIFIQDCHFTEKEWIDFKKELLEATK